MVNKKLDKKIKKEILDLFKFNKLIESCLDIELGSEQRIKNRGKIITTVTLKFEYIQRNKNGK